MVNFLFKALLLKRNENKNIFILCKVKSSKKPFPARVFRFIDNFVREISTIVESKSIEENMILQKREKNIVNFTMVNVVLISGAAAAPSTRENEDKYYFADEIELQLLSEILKWKVELGEKSCIAESRS